MQLIINTKKELRKEYESIVKDIKENKKFQMLQNEFHHGMTRYKHLDHAAWLTFKFTKKHDLDYVDTTRAALLHDFYLDKELKYCNKKEALNHHPSVAVQNAKENFNINKKQENIIASHMFPCGTAVPATKEAWVVTMVDKICAIEEMLVNKVPSYISLYIIYFYNFLNTETN